MPPRKSTERHARVLDAATELIRKKGLDATSLQDIADAVGIKKGSLANYFTTKTELVALIEQRFIEIAETSLRQIVERTDLTPDQRLRELLHFHAAHCAVNMSSPIIVGFVRLWTTSQTEERRQPEVMRLYHRTFEDAVSACISKRLFRGVDPTITVNGLMGCMTWCAFWYSEAEYGPLRPIVDTLIDMCFNGLMLSAA